MQAAGSDDIARYICASTAVDGVSRDMQVIEVKGKTSYVQPPRVVFIRAYIDGRFGRETLCTDIHIQRCEAETDVSEFAVRQFESQQERRGIFG